MHAPEIFGRNLVDICSDDKYIVEESIALLQKSIDKTIEISKYFNKNVSIEATIDGIDMIVPISEGNRHYDEIMRQVDAGELTIEEAD